MKQNILSGDRNKNTIVNVPLPGHFIVLNRRR